MPNMYRQGDVLLVEREVPEDARLIKRSAQRVKGKGIVLAEGEVTGHHHAIKDRSARLYNWGGDRWIKVGKLGVDLVHEEHDTIKIPEGEYEVVRQREYNPPKDAFSTPRPSYVYD